MFLNALNHILFPFILSLNLLFCPFKWWLISPHIFFSLLNFHFVFAKITFSSVFFVVCVYNVHVFVGWFSIRVIHIRRLCTKDTVFSALSLSIFSSLLLVLFDMPREKMERERKKGDLEPQNVTVIQFRMKYIIYIVERNERKTAHIQNMTQKKIETKIGDTPKKGGADPREGERERLRRREQHFEKKRKHSDTANSIMVKLFYFSTLFTSHTTFIAYIYQFLLDQNDAVCISNGANMIIVELSVDIRFAYRHIRTKNWFNITEFRAFWEIK